MDILQTAKDAFSGAILGKHQTEVIRLMQEEIVILRERCARFERELNAAQSCRLPACPFCGKPTWKVTSTRKHIDFNINGLLFVTHTCETCGKSKETLPAET